MKKILIFLLRLLGIALAVALLVWTVSRTGARPWELLPSANPWYMLAAFACVGIGHFLGGIRWGCLLAVQEIRCGWFMLFRLTLVGAFFSQLIPGAVTGDVIKLALVAERNPGHGAEATMTVLFDRIVGVSGLFLVAAFGSAVFGLSHPEVLSAGGVIPLAMVLVTLGGVLSLAGLFGLVHHGWLLSVSWIAAAVRWTDRHLPRNISATVQRLCTAAGAYRGHSGALFGTLAISMAIHALLGLGLFCTGRALGEVSCSFPAYFLSEQVGNAVTIIPAAPGGLGLRESVSAAFFGELGAGNMALMGSIPIVNTLNVIVWALLGAVALGTMPRRRGAGAEMTKEDAV